MTSTLPKAEVLGDKFAELLRKHLTKDEFEEMRRKNKFYNDHCCASHDYLDANMVMDEAMRSLGLGSRMVGQWITQDDELTDLWNAAWNYAKEKHLTNKHAVRIA